MNEATLDEAQAAKAILRERLRGMPGLRGLGITTVDGGYAVKVLVARGALSDAIPDDVDGVPVVVDVVGELTPL
jgi:hypothetical protein